MDESEAVKYALWVIVGVGWGILSLRAVYLMMWPSDDPTYDPFWSMLYAVVMATNTMVAAFFGIAVAVWLVSRVILWFVW